MNFSHELLQSGFEPFPNDFTGVGLVVYKKQIELLPVVPLLQSSMLENPIIDASDILSFLISISRYKDYRHDGFHFAHVDSGLTHISQFFSPPIPRGYIANKFNVGARHRTSELGSLLENVVEVIVLDRGGSVSVFKNGIESKLK